MMNTESVFTTLSDGAQRLEAKGVFGHPDDSLSVRIPGQGSIGLIRVDVQGAFAPPMILSLQAATDQGETALLHAGIFSVRADVGAIAMTRPRWSSQLHRLDAVMPAIFDEQVRQLGDSVPKLKGGPDGWTPMDEATLRSGGNAFLLGDAVVSLGYTLDRAIFNSELLEKCAKSYILASLTGAKIGTIPWLVRYIAGGRLKKDQRHAAEAYTQGKAPSGLNAY